MFTREEYENAINDSPLFTIDKEKNPALFNTEKYAFLTLLTDYYRIYIYPNKPLDTYSLTLIETATECIKYYDKTKGLFLHLFNTVLKRNLSIAKAKEIIDTHRQGLKLSSCDEQMIRKVVAFAKSKNLDIYDDIVQAKIATVFGLTATRVAELVLINDNAVAVSDTVVNEDGDTISLLDLQAHTESSEEEKIIAQERVTELIDRIQTAFQIVQERQKRLLSLLLTTEVIRAFDYDLKAAHEILCKYSFNSDEIYNWYERYCALPTARQIAQICGVSEQSLSRTYKNFKEKLKENR